MEGAQLLGRDATMLAPTGGGKSLAFHAGPPVPVGYPTQASNCEVPRHVAHEYTC